MYQLVVINWTLFCRDGCFPFKQLLWNCCHHLSLRGKKHEPKHTLSPTSTVLPVTFQIWFNHISTLPKLILITVAMTNMLPCGSGVRQGTVFGLETCFVPDFRCHSVLEKDISLRYSDFSWSCSDITNTPVLLLWNSPSVQFCKFHILHEKYNAYANHIWPQVCWTHFSAQAWLIRNAQSTAPFLSFNHWTQCVCVCLCLSVWMPYSDYRSSFVL